MGHKVTTVSMTDWGAYNRRAEGVEFVQQEIDASLEDFKDLPSNAQRAAYLRVARPTLHHVARCLGITYATLLRWARLPPRAVANNEPITCRTLRRHEQCRAYWTCRQCGLTEGKLHRDGPALGALRKLLATPTATSPFEAVLRAIRRTVNGQQGTLDRVEWSPLKLTEALQHVDNASTRLANLVSNEWRQPHFADIRRAARSEQATAARRRWRHASQVRAGRRRAHI